MQIQNPSFSIVVPLFNEAENVIPLLGTIFAAVRNEPGFLEVVLVDDGSQDATASIALGMAQDDPRVRLIQHDLNRGLGAAICTGLNAAEGDLVLYTDADLPFDFGLIPQLIANGGDNCVVTGCRLNRGEGARRWVLTKGYNLLIWLFFGLSLRDVNFACKIFPQKYLRNAELSAEGSFIDVEMLLETRRLGLEIKQVPLTYYPRERGLSTLSRPTVILDILREMFRYTTSQFLQRAAILALISLSPIAKFGACLLTIITAALLIVGGVHFDQGIAWSLLVVEAGIASMIFGRKIGISAVLLPFIGLEGWLLWTGQPFLGQNNYYLITGTFIVIAFSQLGSGSWKLIQRTLKLADPE